ncbi:MAG: COQ9 family protein [Proteobacteria bacterium]|nr:COQ9 family protein [Pseudomonadota bacterium]
MNKQKAAADILASALPLIPFDGWNQPTLAKAAQAAGYKRTDAIRVFPGGAINAVDTYFRLTDEEMTRRLQDYNLDSMKIRARITLALRLKLEALAPHREAVRRALALQAMPLYCTHALRSVTHTVDAMWRGIGDTSSDFNYYTKRLTLAAVFSSTLVYFLEDNSPGFANTHAFLDRRIEDVMKIEKFKYQLRQKLAQFG